MTTQIHVEIWSNNSSLFEFGRKWEKCWVRCSSSDWWHDALESPSGTSQNIVNKENINTYIPPKKMQKASHIQATPKVRQATETSMSCTGKSTSSRADRAKPQIPACVGSKDVLGVQCCMMPSHQKQRQHVRMSLVDIGSSCPLFEHVYIYIYIHNICTLHIYTTRHYLWFKLQLNCSSIPCLVRDSQSCCPCRMVHPFQHDDHRDVEETQE